MPADVPQGCEASMLGSGNDDIDMVVIGVGTDQAGEDVKYVDEVYAADEYGMLS